VPQRNDFNKDKKIKAIRLNCSNSGHWPQKNDVIKVVSMVVICRILKWSWSSVVTSHTQRQWHSSGTLDRGKGTTPPPHAGLVTLDAWNLNESRFFTNAQRYKWEESPPLTVPPSSPTFPGQMQYSGQIQGLHIPNHSFCFPCLFLWGYHGIWQLKDNVFTFE
jgi:hypothetical protein